VGYQMQREFQPTPPILLWRPGHGEPRRLVASPCGGVDQLVLARNRLAFDCFDTFLDLSEQAVWVVDLRRQVPQVLFYGHGGPSAAGLYLDSIVGGGALLAFGTERIDARGDATRRTLWLVDGFHKRALRARPDTTNVFAVGAGRFLADLGHWRVALLKTDGTLIRVLTLTHQGSEVMPFGADGRPPFLLAGSDLLLLGRTLRAYDTVTGALRWERPVPAGATLQAADSRLVVYTAGSTIHLLAHGRDTVVRTGARPLRLRNIDIPQLVHAALSADGLYYCLNVADGRYPGRVVFVPRNVLPR